MADWPELDELKQVLDVTSDDWDGDDDDTRLTALLAAAIAYVKEDVGSWTEETDTPDDALGRAALRRAVLMAQNPGAPATESAADPAYQSFIRGHRRAFPIG